MPAIGKDLHIELACQKLRTAPCKALAILDTEPGIDHRNRTVQPHQRARMIRHGTHQTAQIAPEGAHELVIEGVIAPPSRIRGDWLR